MDFRIIDFIYPVQIINLKKELNRTDKFFYTGLVQYQNQKLRDLISYAYNFVPYYKELFDKHKIKADKIRTIKDLSNIPVLTKEIIRERFDSLICDEKFFNKLRPMIYRTSGSTGTPLKFYHDRYTNISKFTFLWRMWEWAGYSIGKRCAVISAAFKNDDIFNYKRSTNSLYISTRRINKENSLKILDELVKFKCKIIRGYPSSIYNFVNFIDGSEAIKKINIETVISQAETLFDYQRKRVGTVLGAKVFNMYSQWEWVCLAMECEHGMMHHQMENGVLEILDGNNEPLEDGMSGEITGTGFYNRVMPLIRYKMGDLAVKRKSTCRCGRVHDVIERIDGRTEYMVITPDNRYVSGLNYAFKFNIGFDFAQIIQNDKNAIDVKIVRNSKFSDKELKILENNLRLMLGNIIKIKFLFVPKIEPQSNGKIRLVINNLIKKERDKSEQYL